MPDEIRLTCIRCPMGCGLTVRMENGSVAEVRGNRCPRGVEYAHSECLHPTRTLTTTVRLDGAAFGALPVKSAAPVPKERMLDCARALKDTRVTAPVAAGTVVLADVAGTGVDMVATRGAEKRA